VANGESKDITVIDVAKARVVATIPVDGVPEAAVSDGQGKLYVNLEDRNAIAVIDIAARKVVGRYAMAGCNEPTGIAYDARTGLLIAACHNRTAKLIEAASGKDRGAIPIGQNADGSIFDSARRIGFIPCIDGTLTIYALDDKGEARVLQTVKTSEGARTAVYDTQGDRLFLPTAKVERDAKGEYIRARSDFAVLRVEPRR
jgi:YVTN family beta-propeller protein